MEARGRRFWHKSNSRFATQSNATGSFYRLRSQMVALLVARLQTGRRHLDVGCGTGHFCNLMLCLGFDSYGVDPSPTQIEIARKAAEQLGLNAEETFRVGDVDTAFPDEMFDLVTALGVLPYVADWPEFLTALKCRCVPGAIIVLTLTRRFSLFTLIALWQHLSRPSFSTRWRWVLANLLHTGLWSGGFVARSASTAGSDASALHKVARDLELRAVATIDLYNIALLDRRPLDRPPLARFFARHLSWCHIVFFKVTHVETKKI